MPDELREFQLPPYDRLPDVGLYLDQTVRWLNRVLEPLRLPEVTPSMVSNYVKKGYVPAPVKKQYGSELLARLLLLAIGKNVLPLESLAELLRRWDRSEKPFAVRYDLCCDDLAQVIRAVLADEPLPPRNETDRLLRSLNAAVANIILLNMSLETGPRADDTASL